MTLNISAVSATVRVIGVMYEIFPNPSCAYSCGTMPSPCLNPTTPLHAAGMRVEPPPSVATANGTRPAATATAEPPELPPDVRSPRQALRVRPNNGASVRHCWPNSGVVVLPTTMAPACFNRATTTASVSGTWSLNISEPQVVRMPAVGTRSFTATGTPCNGPTASPRITAASASHAWAIAASSAIVMKAFNTGCAAWIRSSAARITSTGETPRARIAAASSVAGVKANSSAAIPRSPPTSGGFRIEARRTEPDCATLSSSSSLDALRRSAIHAARPSSRTHRCAVFR